MYPNLEPRISTGFLNTVNDAVDSDPTATAYINASPNQGQIGKVFHFDDFTIQSVTNSAIATLYGGFYQYVKLYSGAATPALGQALFWDLPRDVAGAYQVTTAQAPSGTDVACQAAGVCITGGIWTPGNYAFIQIAGRATVQYRGTLTDAGAINGPVYVGTGTGADLGLFDVIEAAAVATGDIRRFAGTQITAAANAALGQIALRTLRLFM
jgi:hypothetical protein